MRRKKSSSFAESDGGPRVHFLSGPKRIVELLKAPWPLAKTEQQNLSQGGGEVHATQKGRDGHDGSLWGVGSRCRIVGLTASCGVDEGRPLYVILHGSTSTLSVRTSDIGGIVLAALHQLHLRYKQGSPSTRSLQIR